MSVGKAPKYYGLSLGQWSFTGQRNAGCAQNGRQWSCRSGHAERTAEAAAGMPCAGCITGASVRQHMFCDMNRSRHSWIKTIHLSRTCKVWVICRHESISSLATCF